MTPPPLGPLNASGADDSTDAYDTINWLVKNVPESNAKVGMIGSSYEGFTAVMALITSAPGAKGSGAGKPHGRRLDGG
jgi:predicted acyl esterase